MRKKKTASADPEGHPTTSTSQTLGLIANDLEPGQSAGAEPVLDNLSHRTSRDSTARQRWHTECGTREPQDTSATGRVARAVARPSPLRSEQGDFHHSAPPLKQSHSARGPFCGPPSGQNAYPSDKRVVEPFKASSDGGTVTSRRGRIAL